MVAETVDDLLRVAEEHAGWTDREFKVERIMESLDGTVIATGTLTQTQMGTWRSIPATGRRVSIACCEIVGFDAEGRVISEEAYEDDLGHHEATRRSPISERRRNLERRPPNSGSHCPYRRLCSV